MTLHSKYEVCPKKFAQSIQTLDRVELHTLLIGMHKLIEAEKEAHEATKILVDDALIIMRRARQAQKAAEQAQKEAEREFHLERIKRKQIQNKSEKAEIALRDAISI